MDVPFWLTAALGLYLVGGFVLHRLRLRRLHRGEGLELILLRRIDRARVAELGEVLAAVDETERARKVGAGAVERAAFEALSRIRKAGGVGRSPALAHLDAQVRLTYLANAVNLELVALPAIWRLRRALGRFGPAPELHFALAHAHALLGQSAQALDALGRALYYAKGDAFYTQLVLESPFVEHARPRLRAQCIESLASGKSDSD